MTGNLLAMRAVLAKLDTSIKDGKIPKGREAQKPFWTQLTENDQLKDVVKGGFFTADTLRIAVGYMLRNKKKDEYAKRMADDAMNLFFAIGREMIDATFLADVEKAVRQSEQGTYVPDVKKKKGKGKSKTVILKIPSPRTLKQAEEKSGDVEAYQKFVPLNCESTSMEQKLTSTKRPRTSDAGLEDRPQKRIRIHPSPPKSTDEKKRKPTDELDVAPTGKKTKQDNDVGNESSTRLSKPPLGSVSQAEILEDLMNINMEITNVLAGSSFPYKPSSPGLCFANSSKAMMLGWRTVIRQPETYQPSSPNLSTKPMSREVIWSHLMNDIFSQPRPPMLLMNGSMQHIVGRTCHIIGKGIDVDAVMRELMLWQYREEAEDLEIYGEEEILTVLQRAQNLKNKMDVSRDRFEIVRDGEGGWTGVVKAPSEDADDLGPRFRRYGQRFERPVVVPLTERFDSVLR